MGLRIALLPLGVRRVDCGASADAGLECMQEHQVEEKLCQCRAHPRWPTPGWPYRNRSNDLRSLKPHPLNRPLDIQRPCVDLVILQLDLPHLGLELLVLPAVLRHIRLRRHGGCVVPSVYAGHPAASAPASAGVAPAPTATSAVVPALRVRTPSAADAAAR